MENKNNKRDAKKTLIYVRYLFPLLAVTLTFISAFIPCYLYTTVLGVDDDVQSLFGIVNEYWDPVCEYAFFSTGDLDASILKFSQVFIVSFIVASALFVIGVIGVIYVCVNAFRYFKDPKDIGNKRMLFLTLVPNRVVAFLWQLPMLGLLIYPRYIIYLFKNILGETASVTLTFVDPLIVAAVLCVASIILSIISLPFEEAKGMNPFVQRKRVRYVDEESDEEDYDD